MDHQTYFKLNWGLAGILLLIMLYSALYPLLNEANLTFKSACEGMPEIYCRSRGLTRAFSSIIRLDFESALNFNSYSLGLFSFFFFELLLRFLFIIWNPVRKIRLIGTIDIIQGSLGFLASFLPMIFGL